MTGPSGKTRWTLRAVAALVLLVSTIGWSTVAASAEAPSPVSIEATDTNPGPDLEGVWQASGAIDDAGTFERTDLHYSGSVEHSPVVGAFKAVIEFSGTDGTFTLRVELMFSASGLTGTWQVVPGTGTGAYALASGHGTSDYVFSTATVVLTGVMSMKP
jgi:hypothetical protein